MLIISLSLPQTVFLFKSIIYKYNWYKSEGFSPVDRNTVSTTHYFCALPVPCWTSIPSRGTRYTGLCAVLPLSGTEGSSLSPYSKNSRDLKPDNTVEMSTKIPNIFLRFCLTATRLCLSNTDKTGKKSSSTHLINCALYSHRLIFLPFFFFENDMVKIMTCASTRFSKLIV